MSSSSEELTSRLVVALGSASTIKIGAVEEGLSTISQQPIIVKGIDVASGVPPQPKGRDETQRGAYNRAEGALTAFPEAILAIGIENGMYENVNAVLVDAACIVFLYRHHDDNKEKRIVTVVAWSDELVIPVDGTMAPGPNGEWSYLKDPHIVVTNGARNRKAFLADTIRAVIERREIMIEEAP